MNIQIQFEFKKKKMLIVVRTPSTPTKLIGSALILFKTHTFHLR